MDPIEISSSGSDWDLYDITEDDTGVTSPVWESHPVNTRILPSWTDYGEQSHGASNVDHLRQSRYNFSHNSSGTVGAPDGKLSVEDESHFPLMIENMGQSSNSVVGPFFNEAYDTIDLNVSGKNLRKVLSQKASKRTLPTSILRSASHINSNSLLENVGSSQVHNALGISSHSAGMSSTNHNNYMKKNHFRRDSDDGITVLNNSGSRTLPPSLMYGKSVPTSQFVSSSDIVYRSRINEESADEHDERPVFQAALEDLHQPKLEADLPDGLLTVPLFRHQKIALAWMLQKETKSTHCLGGILADDQGLGKTVSMIALIQMQRALQSNTKAENQCNHKTEALNLDDDDDNCESGLDKSKQSSTSEDVKVTPVSTSVRALPRRPTAGTLVVCPATVLRQWAGELNYKVADESKLSVLIYHGSNRTKDPAELATYDVVVTTYSIVANEVRKGPLVDEDEVDQRDGESFRSSSEFSYNKKRNRTSNGAKTGKRGRKRNDTPFDSDSGALARVVWYRVILDEAQTIKNHRTQMARACCGLRAKRRWCLSGTPIQNAIDDLYSYFRFLKCEPYCVYKSFCNSIKNFIARNSVSGYKKLQAILTPIMLRRTKDTLIDGEPIINLPPKSVCLTKVDFSVEERAFYLKLEAESRSKFKAYAAAGTVSQNYANILLMLLRLRQACDHPLLVRGFNSESVGKVSVDMAKKLPKEMLTNLLGLLETSLAICCLCNDPPEDAVVTMCGHVFCYQCVSLYLTGDENVCPAPECKELLGADIVFSGATLRSICDDPGSISSNSSHSAENSLVQHNECGSSKIGAALKILQLNCKSKGSTSDLHGSMACSGNNIMGEATLENEGPGKAIIFSQWTTMLDLVEISLSQASIQYRRLDGTMSLAARDKAVKDFNADPEVTVMLMSLKAGNLGLNMVAASHVILLDLWWNPTTEDQAVDRAHRIGQTRPVTVSRITIKDTVEDRILALQEEKRKLVASAFGEDQSGGSAARLTVEDLKYLFMANRDR